MNVLLIEDHPITRIGLEQILEDRLSPSLITHATNGSEAVAQLKNTAYDLIFLDIVLPDTDTHSLVHEIKRLNEKAKIIMYSNYNDEVYAMPYISMGACGYLKKTATEDEILSAVEMVMKGQIYVSQKVLLNNMHHRKSNSVSGSPFEKLSKRELELFSHLITGIRLKEICDIMHIEQSTVATLKSRMYAKLGVDNMVALIRLAEEYNMV